MNDVLVKRLKKKVVFADKNTTSAFSCSWQTDSGWLGTLSIINRSLNSNPSSFKYFFHFWEPLMHWRNHSINKTAVTHTFWLYGQNTSINNCWFCFWGHMGSLLCTPCLALSYALQHCHTVLELICLSVLYALVLPLHFYEFRFCWSSSSRRGQSYCNWRLAVYGIFSP